MLQYILNDINAKTHDFIVPYLTDVVYKQSPVLIQMLESRRHRFEGGRSIIHNLEIAELAGGAAARGQPFDISYYETGAALQVFLKKYWVNITLHGEDEALNRGAAQAMPYVAPKFTNAAGKMGKLLGTDLWLDGQGTGSGVLQLDGFNAAVDNGSLFPSYGGLTRADYVPNGTNNEAVNGYVVNVNGSLTLKAVNKAFGACWFGAQKPDFLACEQLIWDVFWNQIQPAQRYYDESSAQAKIGMQAFRFNGALVVVEQYMPAGTLYGLNSESFDFYISAHDRYQFGWTGFKDAQHTDDFAGQYLVLCNLLMHASRLNFKLYGITTT